MIRTHRLPLLAAALLVPLLAVAAVALAAGDDGAPRHPSVSTSPLVALAQPVDSKGPVVLRYRVPGGHADRTVAEIVRTRKRTGHAVREVCTNLSQIPEPRAYKRSWGECETLDQQRSTPFTSEIGSGSDTGTTINGIASLDVERLVVTGPGGTYDVPRGPHGSFVVAYARGVRGRATLTAHLRGGRTSYRAFTVPNRGLPAVPPARSIAPELLAHYGVLRRPQRPEDRYPGAQLRMPPMDANTEHARLLVNEDGIRMWLVPGRRDVCVVTWIRERMGGGGCGYAVSRGYANGHAPMGSPVRIGRGAATRRYMALLVPDGTHDARLTKEGRTVLRLLVRQNVILARYHRGDQVTWRAPDGTRHHTRPAGPR